MATLFTGIISSTGDITAKAFFACIGVSLAIGLWLAFVYSFRSRHSASFVTTLAILPAIVCVIIMMVSGSIGAGVAVAGTFSLVRFRSAPGTAKDIGMIFLAMGAGLAAGMGYLAFAVIFALLIGAVWILYTAAGLGRMDGSTRRTLRITIPEDLDYTGVFDEIFEEYTSERELVSVKTTNMGSLIRLTYQITECDPAREKAFIDALRTRNGNLEVAVSQQEMQAAEL